MKLLKSIFSIAATFILITAACTEAEYNPTLPTDFEKNDAGILIPVRNLSVRLQDGTVAIPGIKTGADCDTAHFSGVKYSEDIVEVKYTLLEGSTINPLPPMPTDSVEVNGKMKRNYWKKDQVYTITNADGSTYKVVFLLDEYLAETRPLAPEELDLFWSDEFNTMDELPDPEIWKLCQQQPNAWSQYFVDGDWSNVRIENGYLKLTANKVNGKYRNGGIRTINGFPKNTRVEVRAKLTHKVRGGFPAIWQMPINGSTWPLSGEIDIMEWIQGNPNDIWQTIHRCPLNNGKDVSNGKTKRCEITEWHTFGVDRTDEAIIFYLDGQETWRFNNPGTDNRLDYPFVHYDFDVILNFSLGGYLNGSLTWPGVINDADLPGEMWVDWVRVYEL